MTNKKNIFFVIPLFLLLVVGCRKKEASVEVISIEQLIGEDTTSDAVENPEITVPELDGTFVSELNQKLYNNFITKSHTHRTLIDRFSTTSAEKTVFISKVDSLATAEFFMYYFPDSSVTMNAFNNLLACFGSKCEEVILQENKSRVEEQPFWCGVFETSIVILKFSPNALIHKNELKQTVFQTKDEALKYTLNVTATNELKWD